MGDSISEGVVESFIKKVGDSVKADDIIARIETDKVTVDILSAHTGVIVKYHAAEGDTVPVGAKFVDIDPNGTPSAAPAATPKAETKKEAPPQTPAPKVSAPTQAAPEPVQAPKAAPAPTPAASSSPNLSSVVSKKAPSEING